MAGVILEHRYRSQPQCPAVLDRSHPLAQGLIFSAYNTATDMKAPPRNYVSGRLGTLKGGTFLTTQFPPAYNSAVAFSFNGTSSDDCSAPIDMSPYRTITVGCWLWWDGYANDNKNAIRYTVSTGGGNVGFAIIPNFNAAPAQKFAVSVWNNSVFYQVVLTNTPSAAAWHHVLAQIDLTQAAKVSTVFVDGASSAITAFANAFSGTSSSFTANDNLYLMRNPNTPDFSAGRIANVNLWGRLVRAAEARALYLAPWDMFMPPRLSLVAAAPSFVPHRFQLAC
jgi:hypothetical protein